MATEDGYLSLPRYKKALKFSKALTKISAKYQDVINGEEYDRQLQQLMLDSLPNILVEVVEQRPPDPIEFMAHALYRYRNRDPPVVDVPSNTQRNAHTPSKPILKTETLTGKNESTVVKSTQGYGIVQGHEDIDDAVHDMEYNGSEVSGRMLHVDILEIFNCVGDLYDDDAIS